MHELVERCGETDEHDSGDKDQKDKKYEAVPADSGQAPVGDPPSFAERGGDERDEQQGQEEDRPDPCGVADLGEENQLCR